RGGTRMTSRRSDAEPGSAEECAAFKQIQATLPGQFRSIFPDRAAPRTVVVLPSPIIDYYLHLLQGVPARHARERLTLIACFDGSARPLTEKILERPRLLARLRQAIGDPGITHIAAYAVSDLERTLAVRLGVPLYGCDPALQTLGSKSGGRQVMREAGVSVPDGVEDLTDADDIAAGLADMKARDPTLR